MAIPISTAPAAKAFLFNLFTTTAATIPAPQVDQAATLVQYDPPGPYQPDDVIAVLDIRRRTPQHAMVGTGGAQALREEYTVEVWIDVFRGGDNPQYTEERAYTILGAIEQAVRTDPSLGGLVLSAFPRMSECQSEWDPDNKGRHTVIRSEIEVLAII